MFTEEKITDNITQEYISLLGEYKKFYETSIALLNNKNSHQSGCNAVTDLGQVSRLKYFKSEITDSPPILIIPSIINKSDILDINPDRSFCNFLKKSHQTYLLDWSSPTDDFTLNIYIDDIINFAKILYARHRQKLTIVGYCLGGNLAIASYFHLAEIIDQMIFIATPWDFSKMEYKIPSSYTHNESLKSIPAVLISLYMNSINADKIIEKYLKFPEKVLSTEDKELFFQVEYWANNGLNLPISLARMIKQDLYDNNLAMLGKWNILGKIIDPKQVKIPCLVITSNNDRIVNHECARALADLLPDSSLIESELGHIGVIISKKSYSKVWQPIIKWVSGIR